MYDQSFNYVSLSKELRKSDFFHNHQLRDQNFKNQIILSSISQIESNFWQNKFLLHTIVKSKKIYRIPELRDELILRKIDRNIRKSISIKSVSRDSIVANLKDLISEGISYRVYRLDIRSFYESFSIDEVISTISAIQKLSPITKKIVAEMLRKHIDDGGIGLPRGLALSATLTEALMINFDRKVSCQDGVFFYARYVDDIVIITSNHENENLFLTDLTSLLPRGLELNEQKQSVKQAKEDVKPYQTGKGTEIFNFEYLGYKFFVFEPLKNAKVKSGSQFRDVYLDIADSKLRKIKTRITKALISFCKSQDFLLLELRLKFLTSNFSVIDANRESKRLAGIYYNYHRVDLKRSKALIDLDKYITKSALMNRGPVFEDFFRKTTTAQRRRILNFSFSKGFKEKTFMHFSNDQLKNIKECWSYA